MTPAQRIRFRLLGSVLSVLVVVVLVAVGWFYFQLRRSLPRLDGSVTLTGLRAPVTAARDASGIPRIAGSSRIDVMRALGFLHGQDRFFQMDLLRRRSAGELSEIFGKVALPIDRATRVHGFRQLATQVYSKLPPDQREVLDAYTAGVNAGLSSLATKPFEYLVLRVAPRSWDPADSILVIYSMTLDLQDSTGNYELSLATLRDQLGFAGVAFFAPVSVPNDAALDGSVGTLPPIPDAKILDLRTNATPVTRLESSSVHPLVPSIDSECLAGSNSFALAGAHTASGAGMLANDPHLDLAVPNIWYRATLKWTEPTPNEISGVTLPGLPAVVIGSNGRIAWGLTDAYADTGDLVVVEVNSVDHSLYKLPGGDELIPIEKRRETIPVKGEAPVEIEIPWTHWGPVVASESGRPVVYHWLAHDAAATDFSFINLAESTSVAEAVSVAHRIGMPAHNLVVVDTAGHIAWTIIGRLPKRFPAHWDPKLRIPRGQVVAAASIVSPKY